MAELSPMPTHHVATARESRVSLEWPLGAGGAKPRPLDVRLVAATNRDLAEDVAEQRFRGDLLAHLAEATLEIPPLREVTPGHWAACLLA